MDLSGRGLGAERKGRERRGVQGGRKTLSFFFAADSFIMEGMPRAVISPAVSRADAKRIRGAVLSRVRRDFADAPGAISLGLPEFDDRRRLWRVALLNGSAESGVLGEALMDPVAGSINLPPARLVYQRLEKRPRKKKTVKRSREVPIPAAVPNRVILGDSATALADFPRDAAQLVVTSPPYYNAKPEAAEYLDYGEYLEMIGRVASACHAVLSEGRFFIVNVSPVLVRRATRSRASRRMPIPFDLHPIITRAGFEFIDDIIWEKPEGAGWCLGRGRRFAADRQPLQYKPVTVTEYILVYRKQTDRLLDWNIRGHPWPGRVRDSAILGEYERTNIWRMKPASHPKHPAVYPAALARRAIQYYSFRGDLVLDPFAGTGTTGKVAAAMGRRFVMIEKSPEYYAAMRCNLGAGISAVYDDVSHRFA